MTQISNAAQPVRVLVVDDSAFMRTALSRMIGSEGGFEVVGTACSGADALEKIPALDPDVVTLDVEMPGMDGVETLRAIMNRFPRPVIMVSAATERGAMVTLQALSNGAFDCLPKQMSASSLDISHIRAELIAKVRAAATAHRARILLEKRPPQSMKRVPRLLGDSTPEIVVIGSSTGGPKALETILPAFPEDLPVPILIVQHMPLGFTQALAERLNSLSAIRVRQAEDGEPLSAGVAYLAPAGVHMRVRRGARERVGIALEENAGNSLHIPSVDVLMKSVAECYEEHAVGVILTGMGSDGAEGMKAIHKRGGLTIGQDEASCAVYGMPKACAELGVLNQIVSLQEIPNLILGSMPKKSARSASATSRR